MKPLLLIFAAVLAGITALAAPPPKELTGKQWTLKKLDRDAVDDTIRSTVTFAQDERAAGATGCNRWFGRATFDAEGLVFSQVGATRMACPKPQMEREAAFTRMLNLTRKWSLAGGELLLAGEDGTVLAVFRSEPVPPQGSKK